MGESGSFYMNIGFDNQKYLQMQSEHIRQRISMFGNKPVSYTHLTLPTILRV